MTFRMTMAPTKTETKQEPSVPVNKWGKDHWSTLAYIETRIVDHSGVPNPEHMRADIDIHPQFGNRAQQEASPDKRYPTILNDGTTVEKHDDWSCVDDMVAVGIMEWQGTGINPVFVLTEEGHRVTASLRRHKAKGGQFRDFRYPDGG